MFRGGQSEVVMRGLFFAWGRVRAGVVIEREPWGWRANVVVRIAPENAPAQLDAGPLQLERGARQINS